MFAFGGLLLLTALIIGLAGGDDELFGVDEETAMNLADSNQIAVEATEVSSEELSEFWNELPGERLTQLLDHTKDIDGNDVNCESFMEAWRGLPLAANTSFPDSSVAGVIEGYELATLRLFETCDRPNATPEDITEKAGIVARSHDIIAASFIASGTGPS